VPQADLELADLVRSGPLLRPEHGGGAVGTSSGLVTSVATTSSTPARSRTPTDRSRRLRERSARRLDVPTGVVAEPDAECGEQACAAVGAGAAAEAEDDASSARIECREHRLTEAVAGRRHRGQDARRQRARSAGAGDLDDRGRAVEREPGVVPASVGTAHGERAGSGAGVHGGCHAAVTAVGQRQEPGGDTGRLQALPDGRRHLQGGKGAREPVRSDEDAHVRHSPPQDRGRRREPAAGSEVPRRPRRPPAPRRSRAAAGRRHRAGRGGRGRGPASCPSGR
jgi:hypothetical protein